MRNDRTRWLAVLFAVAMCACSRDATPSSDEPATPKPQPEAQRPKPSNGHMEGGFFVTADAPPPLVCKADDDCIVNTVLSANGCCIDPERVWVPQSKSYSYWASQYRQQSCEGVTCPPLPAPYPPPDCATEARCVEGACQDSCED